MSTSNPAQDQADNLVLEMLKGLCNDVATFRSEMRDEIFMVKERLSMIETGLIDVKQTVLHLDSKIALSQVGMDKLTARVGRIEDRLGLIEAHE